MPELSENRKSGKNKASAHLGVALLFQFATHRPALHFLVVVILCTVTNDRLTASRRRLRKQVCLVWWYHIRQQPAVSQMLNSRPCAVYSGGFGICVTHQLSDAFKIVVIGEVQDDLAGIFAFQFEFDFQADRLAELILK